MSGPTSIEKEALAQCGELLKFAAENKTGLPLQVIADIEVAWDAQSQSKWDALVASKFWAAYDALCTHLRPVTLDTLSAARPEYSWLRRFGYQGKTPLSHRWARRFLLLLLGILITSMLFAFITTTGEISTQDIKDRMANGDKAVSDIQQLIAQRPIELTNTIGFDDPKLSPDARVWVFKLRQHLIDLWATADALYYKTNAILAGLLFLGEYPLCATNQSPEQDHCYYMGKIEQPNSLANVLENTKGFYNFFETQRIVRTRTDQITTRLAGIRAYLLPALLGMLGACTYVVRTISDQIKDCTFSKASPLRHTLRVALGSIVGVVVVTFYGLPSGVQLSASAWAFVAGYAMEAVFASFDAIAAKLK
jgi:hypothetical protein